MKKSTKELILKLAKEYKGQRSVTSIQAGSKEVMNSEERQEFLKTSEYGRVLGVSEKLKGN